MPSKFTVSLLKIISKLSLEVVFMPDDPDKILISSKNINRLGLELTGFIEYFDNYRLLVMGKEEDSFLNNFKNEEISINMEKIFSFNPPALVIAHGIEPHEEILKAARKYNVPILRSKLTASALIATLVSYLSVELAPRITTPGVFLEVYGEGVLIVGDSGVGKSETAIELIQRGHRLVADDSVEVRKINEKTIVGSSPENIRHFIELRGIGVINARRIFGMGSIKVSQNIDIVINMETWSSTKVYDRLGIDNEYTKILGIEIPVVTVPIKPGRNLAVIIEVAAMNNRQKKMGYNAAQELLKRLGMDYSSDDDITRNQMSWNV